MDVEPESGPRRLRARVKSPSWWLPLFAAAACAAAVAVGVTGCGQGGGGGTKTTQAATQLVSLEAANSPGPSPWTASATAANPPTQVARVADTSAPPPASGQTVSGDQIGLYGGSTEQAVCDRDKLVNFLEQNPAQAQAWRSVTGAGDIRDFTNGLSPVVLTRDTRVTNHGFQNGEATAFQSVLQTGTAVLVDNRGVPRVRCDSGSPLAEPQGDASQQFTGTGWQGWDPNSFVTVKPSPTTLDTLAVVSVAGGGAAPPPSTSTAPATSTETTTTSGPGNIVMQLARMPIGASQAIPDSTISLPPGKILVPVKVAPALIAGSSSVTPSVTPTVTSSVTSAVTSSVTSSPSRTATAPSTTTPSANPGSSGTPAPSGTGPVPATTRSAQTTSVPTVHNPQGTLLPTPITTSR